MKNLVIKNESERLTMTHIINAVNHHKTSFENFSPEAKDIMAREMHDIITNGLSEQHLRVFLKLQMSSTYGANIGIKSPSEEHMKAMKSVLNNSTWGLVKPTSTNQFQEIVAGMCETYISKNHDYGNSFDKSLDEDGLVAAKVRIGDKFNRFGNLIRKENKVSDESMEDTLLDMANYAIMTVMWMRCSKS